MKKQNLQKKIIQIIFILFLCFPLTVFAEDSSDLPDRWKPSETANPTYDAQFKAYKEEESWECKDSKCTNYAGVTKTEDELEQMYQADMSYRAWRSKNKWECKNGTCTNENGESKTKEELKTTYEESLKTPTDEKDKPTYIPVDGVGCEMLSDELLDLLADVYHLIRGVAIVLVVILGIMDFIKAAASNDADALKKSGNKFMKRVIVLAILIMLPSLIEFLMSLIYGADKADACLGKF